MSFFGYCNASSERSRAIAKRMELQNEFSEQELDSAVRRMSLRTHPDKAGGSEEAFVKMKQESEALRAEACRGDMNEEELTAGLRALRMLLSHPSDETADEFWKIAEDTGFLEKVKSLNPSGEEEGGVSFGPSWLFRSAVNDDDPNYGRDGYNTYGYDKEGYDRKGYHYKTGLDRMGYDCDGFDAYGKDRYGNLRADIENLFSSQRDRLVDEWKKQNFALTGRSYRAELIGMHARHRPVYATEHELWLKKHGGGTVTLFGYSADTGRDALGFDALQYDKFGIHRTMGTDRSGLYANGFSKYGYRHYGLHADGLQTVKFSYKWTSTKSETVNGKPTLKSETKTHTKTKKLSLGNVKTTLIPTIDARIRTAEALRIEASQGYVLHHKKLNMQSYGITDEAQYDAFKACKMFETAFGAIAPAVLSKSTAVLGMLPRGNETLQQAAGAIYPLTPFERECAGAYTDVQVNRALSSTFVAALTVMAGVALSGKVILNSPTANRVAARASEVLKRKYEAAMMPNFKNQARKLVNDPTSSDYLERPDIEEQVLAVAYRLEYEYMLKRKDARWELDKAAPNSTESGTLRSVLMAVSKRIKTDVEMIVGMDRGLLRRRELKDDTIKALDVVRKFVSAVDTDGKVPFYTFDGIGEIMSLSDTSFLDGVERVKQVISLGGGMDNGCRIHDIVKYAVGEATGSKSVHLLIIFSSCEMSGTEFEELKSSIAVASHYRLAIIIIGVGAERWVSKRMEQEVDEMNGALRRFDNARYVTFSRRVITTIREEFNFAKNALIEVPDQISFAQKIPVAHKPKKKFGNIAEFPDLPPLDPRTRNKAGQTCIICADEADSGISCRTSTPPHFTCSACLELQLGQPFAKRGDHHGMKCYVCPPDAPLFPDEDVADALLTSDAKISYLVKRSSCVEIENITTASIKTPLGRAMDMIVNDIMCLKCPQCKMVFFDFNGCCALTCANESCNANFCALCLAAFPNSPSTHVHVITCRYNEPDYGRSRDYFLSSASVKKAQANHKTAVLCEFLTNLDDDFARQVVDGLKSTLSLACKDGDLNLDNPHDNMNKRIVQLIRNSLM